MSGLLEESIIVLRDLDDCIVDCVEYLIELIGRKAEGREDHDGVGERSQKDASFANTLAYTMTDSVFEGERSPRFTVGDELDGGDEPALADISYVGTIAKSFQTSGQMLNPGLQVPDDILFFEHVDRGQGCRAGKGVSCVGVTVVEGSSFCIVTEKSVVDLIRGDGGGKG